MPLWDFFCEHCQTKVERLMPSFHAAECATCDTCGTPLTRCASSSLVKFEGAGFHQNDYPTVIAKEYGVRGGGRVK